MQPARSCTNAVSSRLSSNSPSFRQPIIPDFVGVGWIQSAHGIRGEVFIGLNAKSADWPLDLDAIYLLLPGKSELQRFAISYLKPHKNGLIGRLKEIPDRNAAEKIEKSQVYIADEYLESKPGEQIFLKQVLGFTVIDKQEGELGRIEGFATNGPQDLLQIARAKGGQALVPFVDAFIVHIDFDKKQLTMDLPPGLIDLEEE